MCPGAKSERIIIDMFDLKQFSAVSVAADFLLNSIHDKII
jgi:hypothetical protein